MMPVTGFLILNSAFCPLTRTGFGRNMPGMKAQKQKQLSREQIHALRGSLKFDTGGKSFAEWMANWNNEEKELEEAKIARWEKSILARKR
jgi:hypothetical protein